MKADKIVVREIHTGIVHFGEVSLDDAGAENLFGIEHTDMVTIGPNDITHIALVNVVISHAEAAPAGSIDHYV